MKFIGKILVTALAAIIVSRLLPGVSIRNSVTAVLLALVLALLNGVVKPVLIILTIPITILTLGLFLFVINACIILIADKFVTGFKIDSFWHAMLFSILLSFFNSFVHKRAFKEREQAA